MRILRLLCLEIGFAVAAILMLIAQPAFAHSPDCADSSMRWTVALSMDADCDLLAATGQTEPAGTHLHHAFCHPARLQSSSFIGTESRDPEVPAVDVLPAVTVAYRVDTRSLFAPADSPRVDPPPSILFGNFRS